VSVPLSACFISETTERIPMEFSLEVHAKVYRAIIDFSKIYTFILNFFPMCIFYDNSLESNL
jgi:hypothetical protein